MARIGYARVSTISRKVMTLTDKNAII